MLRQQIQTNLLVVNPFKTMKILSEIKQRSLTIKCICNCNWTPTPTELPNHQEKPKQNQTKNMF